MTIKKTAKIILTCTLAALMLAGSLVTVLPQVVSQSGITVNAAAKTYKSGGCTFTENSDGTLTLTDAHPYAYGYDDYGTPKEYCYDITIPAKCSGKTVTRIAANAINNEIQSVYIPYTVTLIEDTAFQSDGLKKISVSDSNKYYCSSGCALYNKDKTTLIKFPAGYGSNRLYDDYNKIKVPSGVKTIGRHAFADCQGIEKITLPDSVLYIEDYAFSWCTNVTEINIPSDVRYIGKYAFYECGTLRDEDDMPINNVWIPTSVKYIGEYAFGYYSDYETEDEPVKNHQISGYIIHGNSGSDAEDYAKKNGFTFITRTNDIVNRSKIKTGVRSNINYDTFIVNTGEKVVVNAIAKSGKAPYSYAYYYKRAKSSTWNSYYSGSTFGPDTSASFIPKSNDLYDVQIIVRDADDQAETTDLKVYATKSIVNNSFINAEKVQIGDDIRITGAAEGGRNDLGYHYDYYFKRSSNTKWNLIGSGEEKSYAVLVPGSAAEYDIKSVVTDKEGNKAEKIFKVTAVKSLPLTNISTITAENINVGKTVTIAGRTVGGTKPCTYEFYFKRSTNTKWNKLSYGNDKHTYAKFTPTTAATYDIKVIAVDSKGARTDKRFTLTAE